MKGFPFFKPLLPALVLLGVGCGGDSTDDRTPAGDQLALSSVTIGGQSGLSDFDDVSPDAEIVLDFTAALDAATVEANIYLLDAGGAKVDASDVYDGAKRVTLKPSAGLNAYASYRLIVDSGLKSAAGEAILTGKVIRIRTGLDTSDKFPQISDEELLTKVQQQTFRYFWEGAEPTSGMARERTSSGATVTTGGTGFGVMAMTVAAERGFVTRSEACQRVQRIVTFLAERATPYHGAFSHWIDGQTGQTLPFSADDNGADLVETGLLFQGLLTARAYFDGADAAESKLRTDITALWEAVEWDFFTKEGTEKVLYWHWSPDKGWAMNMPIQGWNEALIVYVLAASSPTHPIGREVYAEGWARGGAMRNGKSFYDTVLPLGEDYGGPLFWAHYSFLGLNPRGLSDAYADYWEQVCNHTRINYAYCVDNPKGYAGYGADCWGLTASDIPDGYTASSPTNDRGVIAPTAALSSMPYTPDESMAALRFFYYKLGDKLWSDYGFIDAFDLTTGWFDRGMHIAIDQGPIVVMIENYRTGLPWNLFMSDKDVQRGLAELGFTVEAGS